MSARERSAVPVEEKTAHDSADRHAARSTDRPRAPEHAVEQARAEERQGEQTQQRRLHDDQA